MTIKSPSKTNIEISNDACGNDHEVHTRATSRYWLAHSLRGQSGGIASSTNVSYHHGNHKYAESLTGEPLRPAKKARLSEPFSKQALACKGNCPQVWTIESFCELCHS